MSSKKDSAFYDSSSLPYYTEANKHYRKTNSDCYPLQNQYQLCSEMEQLKVKSCDVFPKYIDSQNEMKNSEMFNYMPNLENRKRSCCEGFCISQCSRNFQMPSDPGGGNVI